jgi:hypothetical protein
MPPRERYDAGSGQVSYLLLIGCFGCLTSLLSRIENVLNLN